jgi:ribosomal protein S18 acetylase RimI-like enzyme
MCVSYFKRFRMELTLGGRPVAYASLPSSYELVPWAPSLIEVHADVKYRSFRGEIDSDVFPCLGEPEGCARLMEEISRKDGFLAASTWLVKFQAPSEGLVSFCGTVQGVIESNHVGGIQNLGVVPEHRGRGLGARLLTQALDGFRNAGLKRAALEVTAKNVGAVRLYRQFGFRVTRTVYKAVEVAYT